MTRPTWDAAQTCPHMTQHMPNAGECACCWIERAWGAETGAMLANWEALPFESGAEEPIGDYTPESEYVADQMDKAG